MMPVRVNEGDLLNQELHFMAFSPVAHFDLTRDGRRSRGPMSPSVLLRRSCRIILPLPKGVTFFARSDTYERVVRDERSIFPGAIRGVLQP